MEEKIIKEIVVDTNNIRLDIFLADTFKEFSRAKIQKHIKEGNVLVNGKVEKGSYKIFEGDIIKFIDVKEDIVIAPNDIDLDILFEDDDLIVINKQKDLLTHPTSKQNNNTLVNALLFHCDKLSNIDGDILRQGIVHRLDKNTAGVMVCTKTNEAHINLAQQIKNKSAIRKYKAVVFGEFSEDEGVINSPLRRSLKETVKMSVTTKDDIAGKNAITHFKVLERFSGATYIELELKTGRTHQIRAHMSSISHPVVGDSLYGAKGFRHKILDKIKTREQVLQSFYLKFAHPISGDIMEFELPEDKWDKDIINVLKSLREKQ